MMKNEFLILKTSIKLFVICLFVLSCVEVQDDKYKVVDTYSNGEKKLEIKINLTANKMNCFKSYYSDGILEKEFCIVGEDLEGIYKEYFKNGETAIEAYYKGGKMNGEAKFYHENGNLEQSSHLINGRREGVVKEFDKDGRMKAENYVIDDFIHYIKLYKYDESNNLKSSSENFIPVISLSKDTMLHMDTLRVVFSLPLPTSKFDTGNFIVKFDFKKLESNEANSKDFDYPSNSIPMKNRKAGKSFIMEVKGDFLLYGFLTKEGNEEEERYRFFKKKLFVR